MPSTHLYSCLCFFFFLFFFFVFQKTGSYRIAEVHLTLKLMTLLPHLPSAGITGVHATPSHISAISVSIFYPGLCDFSRGGMIRCLLAPDKALMTEQGTDCTGAWSLTCLTNEFIGVIYRHGGVSGAIVSPQHGGQLVKPHPCSSLHNSQAT